VPFLHLIYFCYFTLVCSFTQIKISKFSLELTISTVVQSKRNLNILMRLICLRWLIC